MKSLKTAASLALLLNLHTWAGRPVGSYTNGSLEDAECLPEHGEGFMQLYRDVNRIWGTSEMMSLIKDTALHMSQKYPGRDRLQVEEISAQTGGDIDGHGSHENGLDVDLGYFKVNSVEHRPTAGQYYAPSMVNEGKVSDNFDVERNWEMMKALHQYGNVGRIFVDQTLKNRLCAYAKSKGEFQANIQVLRSLRHVTNHADHLHVRLNCPRNAPKCVNQPPPPPGAGCP